MNSKNGKIINLGGFFATRQPGNSLILGPWNCQKICDVILYPPLDLGITGERVDEEAARAESCLAKFKDFRYATLKDCQVYGSKSALNGKIS